MGKGLKRTALLVLLMFGWYTLLAQVPPGQDRQDPDEILLQGKESCQLGDYEKSIAFLEQYITIPGTPREKKAEAYYFLAKNYYAVAPDKVNDMLLKVYTTDWFITVEEKDLYFKKASDEARQQFMENIPVEQYLKDAESAFEKGEYDEAKYLYRLISQKLPGKTFEQQIRKCDDTREKRQEALDQFQNRHYEKAYIALKALLRLSPADGKTKAAAAQIESRKILPLIEAAESFYKQNNYKDALPLFEEVLIFMPDNQEMQAKLSVCREMTSEKPAAQKSIAKEGVKKQGSKKKFPVFLAVLGAAAAGAILFLLLKKKKEPAPTTGSINVQSNPQGAAVWLDNTDTGLTTNTTLTGIQAGTHSIKLVKEGYLDYQVNINVEAGKETILLATLTLAPTPNFVTSADTVTVPEGGQSTFQVKLSERPLAAVNASVAWVSGDPDITITAGQSLNFTESNWDSYQPVTLRAIADNDQDNGQAIFRISAPGIPNKDILAVEQDSGGPGYLAVSPSSDFSAAGAPGGPFSPTSKTYILENTGTGSIYWTASSSIPWVSLSLADGRLEPSTSTAVSVSINSQANSLPVGTHTGTITFLNITNGSGSTTRTVSLSITPPDNPPDVTITSPGSGQTVSGTAAVQVTATDDNGISKVEIYIDNALTATLTTAPYTYQWNTAATTNGTHVVRATAYDTTNQTDSDQVSVTVSNSGS